MTLALLLIAGRSPLNVIGPIFGLRLTTKLVLGLPSTVVNAARSEPGPESLPVVTASTVCPAAGRARPTAAKPAATQTTPTRPDPAARARCRTLRLATRTLSPALAQPSPRTTREQRDL